MSIISNLIEAVSGFKNTIQEAFYIIEDFILNIHLGIMSITFIVMTILFFASIVLIISLPLKTAALIQQTKQEFSRLFYKLKR